MMDGWFLSRLICNNGAEIGNRCIEESDTQQLSKTKLPAHQNGLVWLPLISTVCGKGGGAPKKDTDLGRKYGAALYMPLSSMSSAYTAVHCLVHVFMLKLIVLKTAAHIHAVHIQLCM